MLVAIALIVIIELFFLPGQPFDAAEWKADIGGTHGARHDMVPRMIAWNSLVGLPRDEVIEMLGESNTDYFREYDLVYRVGDERSLISLDSEWLVIRFGADGTVSEARLVND